MSRSWFSEYAYGDERELVFYETDWWSEAMWNEIHNRDSEWASELADHYDKGIHNFTKINTYEEGGEQVCEFCDLTPEQLLITLPKEEQDIIHS